VLRKRKESADDHHISQKYKTRLVLQTSDHCKRDMCMSDSFSYRILVEMPVTDSTVLLLQTKTSTYQNCLTIQDKCQKITVYWCY